MSYSDVVATIALFVSVFGTFASGYISYHFAIKGERRKEYNAVADRIMLSLLNQRLSVSNGDYPPVTLTNTDKNSLLIVCPKKQKKTLLHAFSAYFRGLHDAGDWVSGRYSFHSPEKAIDGIDKLLDACERK